MRIQIDFDKKNRSDTIIAMERFLNYYLIGTNHGTTFEAILITLIEKPSRQQKFKRRYLYKKYADISVSCTYDNYSDLTIENFNTVLTAVEDSIEVIREIKTDKLDFNEQLLKADISKLKAKAPKTEDGLMYWIKQAERLDKDIHLKRMDCRENQRRNSKRALTRKIKRVRMYDKRENQALRPYLNYLSKHLAEKFKSDSIQLPNYSEIYFSISDSIEDAKTEFPLETWHEYTYFSINYDTFENATESMRFEMLFDLIEKALQDLADIDNLDSVTLKSGLLKTKSEVANYLNSANPTEFLSSFKADSRREQVLMNRE
jgi:hypothetical protein